MILQFKLPENYSNTTKKDGSFADGRFIEIADFQERVREYSLLCQSCHHRWDAALPKSYSVYRCPCPNCKCDTHGNVLAVMDRF